ncbi:hypothetical protein [Paenibacillus xylaniclasticus]|uniref:hypothetical protein n=1 Tax=Paenibacillus xylaniclasticus TaxID=588083 RepID=UPI000FDB10B5|nr:MULTISPECIES: hypothetical protein [Paenibacillus]GFN32574.1 hypothetical protein PCURB6_28340 [Paenibacillus curdlanolyticus]
MVTTMGMIVLGIKAIIAGLSSVSLASGVNWFNKKVYTSKGKGGLRHESDFDSERFNRFDVK